MFQNLGAIRATELLDNGYSLKNVADWLGHTERIDIEHCQSTTSEHVSRASADWTIERGTRGGDKSIRKGATQAETVEQPKRENPV